MARSNRHSRLRTTRLASTRTIGSRRPFAAAVASSCCVALTAAWAQDAPNPVTPTPASTGNVAAAAALPAPAAPVPSELDPVTVVERQVPVAGVSGWGDIPLARTPLQVNVVNAQQMKDLGIRRLADLTASDPAVSDAYNSEGYYDFLAIRGFVLDNRFNYRRDGLPINAETWIPLDNKASIEVLKGTSGMQAGTSAPGGIVNYVVKRPTDAPLRSASLEWRQPGTVTGAVDLSQRFGADSAFGLRLNVAAAHLDPMVRHADGDRNLYALAGDWRLGSTTLLEAEVESSHRSQYGQPGFSMLGNTVPPPGDPRINLNDQPWSPPGVFDADTASLRWRQELGRGWRFVAHAATQRLRTDDRTAFPFGCTAADGTYYADRYCPDGTFDLYDYRSEDERRRSDALDLSLQGAFKTGAVGHDLTAGILQSRVANRFQPYAYNYAGTGNIEGTLITPPSPAPTQQNTDRDEHSTELYMRDAIALTERLTAWLGARHTRLSRASVQTDGSQPTAYAQSFTTPFVAASYLFAPEQIVYASWGQGIESEVTPALPNYTNKGQPLPSLKSRQSEVGIKGATGRYDWSIAWFDIVRPLFDDIGTCATPAEQGCITHQVDGSERHRGLEATGSAHLGAWTVDAGLQALRARREGSQIVVDNGLQPTNVPERTLKVGAGYDVASLPGLRLLAHAMVESRRMVLPDNSASIPGLTRVDAGLRYTTTTAGGTLLTWRAGVDNLFDRRAWRESPYQYSHVYLYPLAPRTAHVALDASM